MWISSCLAVLGLILLAIPATRRNEKVLLFAALFVFVSIWMDKGLAFIVAGFIPNSFEQVTEYLPHWNEVLVAVGVLSIGILVLTVLYKIAISVKEEQVFDEYGERQIRDPGKA
jgi:molybdopterin-containing oxidoreductase family membrane subunit